MAITKFVEQGESSILIEATGDSAGGNGLATLNKTIKKIAQDMGQSLDKLDPKPAEVNVDFGLRMQNQNQFIVTAGLENAHFRIQIRMTGASSSLGALPGMP